MGEGGVPRDKFALTSSRGFNDWLAASGGSLAFTTYQAGKLFLIGLKPDGALSVFERTFPRAMGLAVSDDGRSLALATLYQIQRFDSVVPAESRSNTFPSEQGVGLSPIPSAACRHSATVGSR